MLIHLLGKVSEHQPTHQKLDGDMTLLILFQCLYQLWKKYDDNRRFQISSKRERERICIRNSEEAEENLKGSLWENQRRYWKTLNIWYEMASNVFKLVLSYRWSHLVEEKYFAKTMILKEIWVENIKK